MLVLTRPLLSVAFKSLIDIPHSNISLKQSLSNISLQLLEARSNFVTTGT